MTQEKTRQTRKRTEIAMYIRRKPYSLHDLEKHFSPLFCRRLRRLLQVYKRMKRIVDEGIMVRALSVASAFVTVAADGNYTLASNFDAMLHGECAECIEMDGMRLIFTDEMYTEEALLWDATGLMLEEYEPAVNMPQFAYDIVERHVWMAYRSEVMNEDVQPEPVVQNTQPISQAMANEFLSMKETIARQQATIEQQNKEIAWLRKQQELVLSTALDIWKASAKPGDNYNFNGPVTNNGGTVTGDIS